MAKDEKKQVTSSELEEALHMKLQNLVSKNDIAQLTSIFTTLQNENLNISARMGKLEESCRDIEVKLNSLLAAHKPNLCRTPFTGESSQQLQMGCVWSGLPNSNNCGRKSRSRRKKSQSVARRRRRNAKNKCRGWKIRQTTGSTAKANANDDEVIIRVQNNDNSLIEVDQMLEGLHMTVDELSDIVTERKTNI